MPHVSSSVKNAIDKHWHWSEIDNESGHQLKLADIAFEHTKDGVIVMNENACILRVNKSFTTMSGFSAQELLGLTPKALQVSDNDAWLSLLLSGKWTGEALSYRKNGEAYQERITFSAVKNAHNEVIYYVGVFTDITEVKHSQLRLHELVNHDPLTSLPNRRLFNELLEHAIRRAERESHQIALLFIDLDRFKAINDSLGHQVGDRLLQLIGPRIKSEMSEVHGTVARMGESSSLRDTPCIKSSLIVSDTLWLPDSTCCWKVVLFTSTKPSERTSTPLNLPYSQLPFPLKEVSRMEVWGLPFAAASVRPNEMAEM